MYPSKVGSHFVKCRSWGALTSFSPSLTCSFVCNLRAVDLNSSTNPVFFFWSAAIMAGTLSYAARMGSTWREYQNHTESVLWMKYLPAEFDMKLRELIWWWLSGVWKGVMLVKKMEWEYWEIGVREAMTKKEREISTKLKRVDKSKRVWLENSNGRSSNTLLLYRQIWNTRNNNGILKTKIQGKYIYIYIFLVVFFFWSLKYIIDEQIPS